MQQERRRQSRFDQVFQINLAFAAAIDEVTKMQIKDSITGECEKEASRMERYVKKAKANNYDRLDCKTCSGVRSRSPSGAKANSIKVLLTLERKMIKTCVRS